MKKLCGIHKLNATRKTEIKRLVHGQYMNLRRTSPKVLCNDFLNKLSNIKIRTKDYLTCDTKR